MMFVNDTNSFLANWLCFFYIQLPLFVFFYDNTVHMNDCYCDSKKSTILFETQE